MQLTLMLKNVRVKQGEVGTHQKVVSAPHSWGKYKLIDIPAATFLLHQADVVMQTCCWDKPKSYLPYATYGVC